MKRRAFTLVEMMISVAILTIIILVLCNFTTETYISLGKYKDTSDSVQIEYQDVTKLRQSDVVPSVNKTEALTLVESAGGFEMWAYKGEHINYYKLFKVEADSGLDGDLS